MGGTFTQQTANPSQGFVVLAGQEKRIKVEFKDLNDVYYDPYILTLTIYRPDNSQYFAETYSLTSTIKKEEAGKYYIDFTGDVNSSGDYQFIWAWRDASGGEMFNGFQTVFMAPIQAIGAFPYLKNQIDKAQKDLNQVYGYNDSQLYMYLKGGLGEINRVPPQTSFSLVTFPWALHQQLLIDISTFTAIVSQSLLSIDTDANYSLQGNSMNVDHFSKLSSFMSTLSQRMNLSLTHFKLNYLTGAGSVKAERGPGFRQVSIFQASPAGTSFGNILGVR